MERLRQLLAGGHTPERIAFSLAAGMTLGVFPILGTTTLLCVALGVAFRLNHAGLQLGNQLMYPFQLPLILVFVHVGAFLLGAPAALKVVPDSWTDPAAILDTLARTGGQAAIGWAVCAPLLAAALYFATLPLLRKMVDRRPPAADSEPLP
jgi:uncharacterized protein (DUF2062 family)